MTATVSTGWQRWIDGARWHRARPHLKVDQNPATGEPTADTRCDAADYGQGQRPARAADASMGHGDGPPDRSRCWQLVALAVSTPPTGGRGGVSQTGTGGAARSRIRRAGKRRQHLTSRRRGRQSREHRGVIRRPTRRAPAPRGVFGVVGTSHAWNYPLQMAGGKCLPALAAGCTG